MVSPAAPHQHLLTDPSRAATHPQGVTYVHSVPQQTLDAVAYRGTGTGIALAIGGVALAMDALATDADAGLATDAGAEPGMNAGGNNSVHAEPESERSVYVAENQVYELALGQSERAVVVFPPSKSDANGLDSHVHVPDSHVHAHAPEVHTAASATPSPSLRRTSQAEAGNIPVPHQRTAAGRILLLFDLLLRLRNLRRGYNTPVVDYTDRGYGMVVGYAKG